MNEDTEGVGNAPLHEDVTGLNTTEFEQQDRFDDDADWDFEDTWTMGIAPDGYQRPVHRIACNDAGSPFGGGAGVENDPYRLCSPDHLHRIGTDEDYLDRHFIVTRDIDMAGVEEYNVIGDVENLDDEEGLFSGLFDGNGYSIKNLTIDDKNADFIGLFGAVDSGAELKNIALKDVDVSGNNHVGGLAGRSQATITDCYATGSVRGEGSNVGGLVARSTGAISSSYATVSATGKTAVGGLVGTLGTGGEIRSSYATGSVEGDEWYVGGLVGNSVGSIMNSYATGSVEGGTRWTGGLVGLLNSGKISSSYAAGSVDGGAMDIGGLVGEIFNEGDVEDSFWDTETSGMDGENEGVGSDPNDEGVTGLDTDDFAEESIFGNANWDFDLIWTIGTAPDDKERPIFQWQDE